MKNQQDSQHPQEVPELESGAPTRKPYSRPAFRHERVFETMALTCGKVQSTQGQCHNNRKNS